MTGNFNDNKGLSGGIKTGIVGSATVLSVRVRCVKIEVALIATDS